MAVILKMNKFKHRFEIFAPNLVKTRKSHYEKAVCEKKYFLKNSKWQMAIISLHTMEFWTTTDSAKSQNMSTWTFSKFKNLLEHLQKLYPSNKSTTRKGKNWPVYNQVKERQSYSFKTANITLVVFLSRTLSMPYQQKHVENHNSMQMWLEHAINAYFSNRRRAFIVSHPSISDVIRW